MAKLAIMGTIEVVPGKRDEVVAALMAHRARSLKDEPGTLYFEVALSRDDQSTIHMFEIYKDDEAFEAHRAAPSIARWKSETAGMVLKVYGPVCTLVE